MIGSTNGTVPTRRSGRSDPEPAGVRTIGSKPSKPRLGLPYLQVAWHGNRPYAYYRRGRHRAPITDGQGRTVPFSLPPSPQWLDAYRRIHAAFADPARPGDQAADSGSLAALVKAYLDSPDWRRLREGTKRDYRRHLDYLRDSFGALPVATMPRAFVLGLRDHLADRPRTANYVIQVLRRVLQWGVDRGWRSENPARRPRQLPGGTGHRPWEEAEIARFRAAWRPDQVQRIAFELMLNTGQRGGDVVALTCHQIGRDSLTIIQAKTRTRLTLPVPPAVAAAAAALQRAPGCDHLLVNSRGHPLQPSTFRHMMRAAYRAANLSEDCTGHGLRHTAATRLRELGCDWEMIASVTGHRTAEMTRRYSRQQRQAALAVRLVAEAAQ